jgi:hypothetical protein
MRQRHAEPDSPWAHVGELLSGRSISEEQRAAIVKTKHDNPWTPTQDTRRRMSDSHRNIPKPQEVRERISEKAKLRVGVKNNQFGTRWVTKGAEDKKIKGSDLELYILNGWQPGRKNRVWL